MIEKILSTVNLTGTKEIKHILQTKAFRENHLTRIKQCFWLYWQTGFQIYNTYGTPQAHQSHLHSHQQCHISTRMECICQFCNGTVKGEKERRKVSIILFFFSQKTHKLWEIKWLCHCSTNYVFRFYNTYFFNDLFWRCSALWLQVIDVTIVLMTLVHSLVVPLIKTIYWTFMHSMTWSFKVLLRTII